MTRWIGFGYLIAAAGGAILPHPLRWWPFVITTVVALIALVGQVTDQRAHVRDAAHAADLAHTRLSGVGAEVRRRRRVGPDPQPGRLRPDSRNDHPDPDRAPHGRPESHAPSPEVPAQPTGGAA